jgi:hypothetical protein
MVQAATNQAHPRFPIAMEPAWRGPGGFERFVADIGGQPGPGFRLVRLDPDGAFARSNLEWRPPRRRRADHGSSARL